MNLDRLLRARLAFGTAFVALCLATAVLAGALVIKASQPRQVVVVPGITEEAVLSPGEIPDEAACAFAMLYVARFDTYTPTTVGDLSEQLKTLVAPAYWSRAAEALEKRRKLSVEGRMSSQVILPAPGEVLVDRVRGLEVTVPAYRRVFIGDRPAREGPVRYRLLLEMAPPGPGNPRGLVVAEQAIEEVADEGD
ncbi:MAG: TraE/TraK family type IV conjugative transfer system protein [Planctomycetota bacterium]